MLRFARYVLLMPVEAVTYISDLNPSNPLGTGEPKSFGDDHLRNLKLGIKNTFPNITGAVTPTHTELNNLLGITGKTGTGNVVLSASPTLTGTVTAATVAATTLTGAGSGITALNASNLASGTVPDARFPATLPALSGANLTALNASNLASGSVADARLGNAALVTAANIFTAAFCAFRSLSASSAYVRFDPNSTTKAYVGVAGATNDLATGAAANDMVIRSEGGAIHFSNAGATAFLKLSAAGIVTTPSADAAEVGFRGTPDVSMTGNLTMDATHAGKRVFYSGAGSHNYRLPGGTSIPEGTVIRVINFGGGTITIDSTTNGETMYLLGAAGASGNRVLAVYGACTLERITTGSDQRWMISGIGLT